MQRTPIVTQHLPSDLTELLLTATPYVPPLAIEMLDDLAGRAGQSVTVGDLVDRHFMSPNQVWVYVSLLRRALGDNRHNPRYIRTARTGRNARAYQYVGPVAKQEVA